MSASRLVDKTGPLKYTQNYVYNNADCLGKGATASVYLGRSRNTGDVVAIKVFGDQRSRHIDEAKKRELELLRSISHKNVMRLIACENETVSGKQVLVMQYCSGGSIFTLLEQPQNAYGFEEEDFLRFLGDTSSGLQYLWSRGIIHRDIKPGNLMKLVKEDGSVSYVVADFGAARELKDEETFMSIYGTEEYIHPDMFQRAVLRQTGQNHFTSSVDLWSLGVTIYHVATGGLPFKAFGGRSNAQMMFQITSNRESGVISGVQTQQDGQVQWSRELPKACRLSCSLKKLLQPLLSGLFEADSTKALTFESYFEAVTDIVNRVRVQVFNHHAAANIYVYMRKIESYAHIQEKIAALTEIPSDRQLLLMFHKPLHEVVDIHDQIQTYPKYVLRSNIFLYEKDNCEIYKYTVPEIPPFPSLPVESSINNDVKIAKECTAVAFFIEVQTSDVLKNQTLLQESLFNLRLYVKDILQPLEACVPDMESMLVLTKKRLNSVLVSKNNIQLLSKLLEVVGVSFNNTTGAADTVNGFTSTDDGLTDVIKKANLRVDEIKLYMSVLVNKMKEQAFGQTIEGSACHEEDNCLSKIQHHRQTIQGILGTFLKHKKYGELHDHELFIHRAERQKLEDVCVKELSLYQGHCIQNLAHIHKSVQKHVSILMKHLTRAGKVDANVKCVAECQGQVNGKIDKIDDSYKSISEVTSTMINGILSNRNQLLLSQSAATNVPTNGKTQMKTTAAEELTTARSQKAALLDCLNSEMENLQMETSELDGLMKSNIDSLVELKRLLQEQGSLRPASINQEQKHDCS